MVEIRQLGLDGVLELIPKIHGDQRGFFSETWSRSALSEFFFSLSADLPSPKLWQGKEAESEKQQPFG